MEVERLLPMLPLIVVGLTVIAGMMAIAFSRRHEWTAGIAAAGLALAFCATISIPLAPSRRVTPLLLFDNLAVFYLGLVLAASLLVVPLAYGYFRKRNDVPDEFFLLLLMAALGCGVLVASSHFASFFLGLEILSVSLYAMAAYSRGVRDSIEAGIKYLILAAGSSSFLLFGMALLYAEIGSMDFQSLPETADPHSVMFLLGVGLVIVGIGFKLAVVPFHMWTPDVYQGAPAPATAFIASVSKGAMFAVLLRFSALIDVQGRPGLMWVFLLMAVASMTVGNFLALLQDNVKRILAYSSIANLGYLLVAFLASGALASTAAAYYLTAYFAAVLGSFGVIVFMSPENREADAIEDYRGLFWRNPWVAAAFTVMMLSLAGIPLTAGFIGKFFVLAAAGQSAWWILLIAVILNSTLGLYYYLRVILVMGSPVAEPAPAAAAPAGKPLAVTLCFLTAVVVFLGVCPAP
ncbi:MAG: NADH-quinone oxidoreductase subunit, partial [Candidatus Hydrogenedentes bacterium]|nr:NADH-quinone oxidoreductase subunit [Candidatus Hydrogenedentota bacterium]